LRQDSSADVGIGASVTSLKAVWVPAVGWMQSMLEEQVPGSGVACHASSHRGKITTEQLLWELPQKEINSAGSVFLSD
jgi:hypothetical protein